MNEYIQNIKEAKKIEIVVRELSCTTRFQCSFIKKQDDSLIFTKPLCGSCEFDYPKGQPLEIYVYTPNGVFRLKCRLLECMSETCSVSTPFETNKIQRREFIRVKLKVKTIVTIETPTFSKKITTGTKDISAKGMKILLDEDISKYTNKIELSILFPENIIKTLARIIKVIPTKTQDGLRFVTSLMFITISGKDMDFIVKKCFEFQAAQRRKMLDEKN